MDLSSPSPTTNPLLTPVFGDNVQDLLGNGTINVNPTGIIVVNSIAYTVDDPSSGVITLRDAINQANADNGQDLIVFDRSLFSNQQTITLSGTELDITHNLDIIAPRDPLTGGDLVTVSGNNASRVFEIGTGATVTVSGLIVADGNAQRDSRGLLSSGGGILNRGILTLDSSSIIRNNSGDQNSASGGGIANFNGAMLTISNSTLSNNISFGLFTSGGGIYNDGNLVVSNSTINGNSAKGDFSGSMSANRNDGGGIYNSSTGTVIITNSTISGNSANGYTSVGGAIFNNGGTVEIDNSTISGNSVGKTYGDGGGIANNSGTVKVIDSTISGNSVVGINSSVGGGISNDGTLTVLFSTVTLNQAKNYGGVYSSTISSAMVRNTIIAQNLSMTGGVNPDVSGKFTSFGYNLIGDSTGSTGFGSQGDIVGTSDNPIDPRLAPLDFYGGSTQTFALLPDSPAIGAGDPTILDTDPTTDQRGLPRVSGGRADIGAFEFS